MDDCERQLRDRDSLIARQVTELDHRRECERELTLERQRLSEQHAEQIAGIESQVAELQSRAEAERTLKRRLEHEIEQLAEEGKVICLRLALFADMMKDRPWIPKSLREVGATLQVIQGPLGPLAGRFTALSAVIVRSP